MNVDHWIPDHTTGTAIIHVGTHTYDCSLGQDCTGLNNGYGASPIHDRLTACAYHGCTDHHEALEAARRANDFPWKTSLAITGVVALVCIGFVLLAVACVIATGYWPSDPLVGAR